MYDKSRYLDVAIKYLLLSIPPLLISGPLLPEIAIGLVFILVVNKIVKNEIRYFDKPFIYGFLLFYFFLILGSLMSDFIFLSSIKTVFYIRFFILTLAVYYILNNSNNFLLILKNILLIIFIILIIDGFYQYFFHENIIGMANPNIQRISSFFGDELIYGSFLSKFLPILIGLLIFFHKNNRDRILIYFITFLAVIAIFVSGERASLILTFISISIIMICTNFFSKSKFYIFILLLLGVSILTLSNQGLKDKWQVTISNVVENFSKRIVIEDKKYFLILDKKYTYMGLSAIKMFKDKPILGQGVKTFRFNCKKKNYGIEELDDYNFKINCGNHPHNTYLQLLAETGILGFVFVISFFIFTIFSLVKSFFCKKKRFFQNAFDLKVCILSCIFINLFPFSTTGSFFNNWLSIIYFFPIGFLFYLNKTYKF